MSVWPGRKAQRASARSSLAHYQALPDPSWHGHTERDHQDHTWLGSLTCPPPSRHPGTLSTTRVLAAPMNHQGNVGRAQEIPGEEFLGSLLPWALSWPRGRNSPLPSVWAEYFSWLDETFGRLGTRTGIQAGFWHWRVGRASVGKWGLCFLEVVGVWLPEMRPGDPRATDPESRWLQALHNWFSNLSAGSS